MALNIASPKINGRPLRIPVMTLFSFKTLFPYAENTYKKAPYKLVSTRYGLHIDYSLLQFDYFVFWPGVIQFD